jgi:FixJ family two-component response regulator
MTFAHPLVYVIGDDLSMRKAIGRLLESEDYPVELLTEARSFLLGLPIPVPPASFSI